jgi:hypothetical protein
MIKPWIEVKFCSQYEKGHKLIYYELNCNAVFRFKIGKNSLFLSAKNLACVEKIQRNVI